jgi:hypothetical protein
VRKHAEITPFEILRCCCTVLQRNTFIPRIAK